MNQDCEKKNKAPKLSNDLGPKDTGEGLSDSNFTTKGNFRLIFMREKEREKRKGNTKTGGERSSQKNSIYSFDDYLSGIRLCFKLVRSDAKKNTPR